MVKLSVNLIAAASSAAEPTVGVGIYALIFFNELSAISSDAVGLAVGMSIG